MSKRRHLYRQPLLVLQLGGWTAYAITDHIGHLMYGSNHLVASTLSGLVACLLTGGLAFANNRMTETNAILRLTIFAPVLFVTSVIWKNIFNLLHQHATFEELLAYSLQEWVSGASYSFYLFSAWAGLYLSGKYFLTSREQRLALNEAQLATKQAQLQTLRYQLNPHFLFNVLNSIDVSILDGDNQTSHEMVSKLSQFLRNSLKHQEKDKISLQQEMQVMQDFIDIEKVRFGDSIRVDISIPDVCSPALLPPMLLLPLVENALKFAWRQSSQGKVKISAKKYEDKVRIRVVNSKSADNPEKSGTGTGLRNTINRLKVAYGEDASINIDESDTEYKVDLSLPWITRFQ